MSDRAVKTVAFLVAGGALVAIAEVAPDFAVGMTVLVGIGVLLGHANELQALSNAAITATGHKLDASGNVL